MAQLAELLPPPGSDPLEVLDAFAAWAAASGRPLYQHQEDAAFALAAGDHVVLATPTGSGKSLVAVAGVLLARNAGLRAVWTAPIKALVAEKFFDLVDLLGAVEVGLATGDAAINFDAPVLVCTAEVLANHALGDRAGEHVRVRLPRRVPLLRRCRPRLGLAGAAARADRMPDAARLGDVGRHDGDHDRPGRAVGAGGHGGDLGRSADAALPPVAHDSGRRERPRGGRRRTQPGVRRARQPSGGDRAGASARQPQRHHPRHSARRSPRRWPTFGWAGDSATPSTD